jgi:non-ribosomal peptide synthetase-like protein
VRDVYESPTVRQLAAKLSRSAVAKDERVTGADDESAIPPELRQRPSMIELLLVTLAQGLWLLLMLLLVCGAGALVVAAGLPFVRGLTIVQLVLLTPVLAVAGLAAYAVVALAFAVVVKRILIGAYRAARVPMWTWAYLRHWIVGHAAGAVPWWLLAGTELQMIALRALGARIGRRVHLHHGVDVRQGGWDLLEIGDEVSVGADGELRLVDLEAQQLVIGPIAIAAGATIETRAGLAGGTRVGAGARLTALSDLGPGGVIPAGESWSGVPARSVGPAPPRPDVAAGRTPWSPVRWMTTLMAGALVTELLVLLPAAVIILAVATSSGATTGGVIEWLIDPEWNARSIVTITAIGLVAPLVSVWWSAVVRRVIGAVPEGVVPRQSAEFARVWIKTGLLERAGHWVSGTVLWPVWLRIVGTVDTGRVNSDPLHVEPGETGNSLLPSATSGVFDGLR